MTSSPPSITERIDVAFERAAWRFPESPPKKLYLDPADWAAFDALMSAEWGGQVHCFSYRDLQIFAGNRSRLILKHGIGVSVPKSISARVAA
jgi:hypothetical protein